MRYLMLLLLFVGTLIQAKPSHNILFVIDNSGSMVKQRDLIDRHFGVFLEELRKAGIDKFKLGITTTDFFSHLGHLFPPEISAPALITSESENPEQRFTEFLASVKDTPTSFWEQGLEASMATVKTFPEVFLVPGESLIIIYVSDEEDYSCKEDCFGAAPENNPNWKPFPLERYVDFYQKLKSEKNIDVRIFPIVGMPEGSCSVPSYGTRYLALRSNVGGIAGSVCEKDVVKSLLMIPEYLGSPDEQKPDWKLDPISFTTMEDRIFHQDLAAFALGDNLSFSRVSGPDWGMLSMSGQLTGVPMKVHVGVNVFIIRASNSSGNYADVTVKIDVIHVNHAPNWTQNPIDLGMVKVNSPFMSDLASYVTDPDGDPLRFTMVSGPAWIVIDGNAGGISGTPGPSELGKFSIKVSVIDIHGNSATTTVIGEVVE